MAQLPSSSLGGHLEVCLGPSSRLEFYEGRTEGKNFGEREVGVKAEKTGTRRGFCEGRDGTGYSATDPLLMMSHGLGSAARLPWEPVLDKAG